MKITLNRKDIAALAERVEAAQLGATAIPKLTDDFPAMTLADGYAVQLELRRRWLARGHRHVGPGPGQRHRDRPPEAPAGPGHDGDAAIEARDRLPIAIGRGNRASPDTSR